jgi:hypothetical protein
MCVAGHQAKPSESGVLAERDDVQIEDVLSDEEDKPSECGEAICEEEESAADSTREVAQQGATALPEGQADDSNSFYDDASIPEALPAEMNKYRAAPAHMWFLPCPSLFLCLCFSLLLATDA